MSPAVVPAPPEKAVADALGPLIAAGGELAGYSYGTRVAAGVTPKKMIRFRTTDVDSRNVVEYPTVQVQVWADGNDITSLRVASVCAAALRPALRAQLVAGPVHLPDPVTPSTNLAQFSIRFPLRGAPT